MAKRKTKPEKPVEEEGMDIEEWASAIEKRLSILETRPANVDDATLLAMFNKIMEQVEPRLKQAEQAVGKPVEVTRIDGDYNFQMCLEVAVKGVLSSWGNNLTQIYAKGQTESVVNDIVNFAMSLHEGIVKRFAD